jgi:hypothetical protein
VGYRSSGGEDDPQVRACRLSLAVDYHLAGETDQALVMADESLCGYTRDLGEDHPFTQIARSLRAVFLRGLGEFEEAVVDGERAAVALTAELRETHPWVIAARVNQAGNLAASGAYRPAQQLLDEVLELGRQFLGPRHPHLTTARQVRARVVTGAPPALPAWQQGSHLDFVDLEVPDV